MACLIVLVEFSEFSSLLGTEFSSFLGTFWIFTRKTREVWRSVFEKVEGFGFQRELEEVFDCIENVLVSNENSREVRKKSHDILAL